ncbi:MAG: hypothetical protein A3F73_14275 [Gallionellales bacterium RIFCSPLOWO2_12_FULL_59_22]|nr:MAG: hypothetical protein A3H99_01605 [Gallionellales bacterium RIFCSPLOWO2_02_FULL_59_110]OGT03765.1 MAG: hypothetical protein A2Z65_07080 [Gallionellales bacterium RIFCSPLOWO2_02_58_13]OGT14721.1 MAG: hypothetical protein A3F73_14275 [Gallionellales bacterium RIFCSPLOWO2_12_FULL_59_22]
MLAALAVFLAGCGGGGGSSVSGGAGIGPINVEGLAAADPTQNPQAPWNALVVLDASLPLVTVNGSPVVNFAVRDAGGNLVRGLKLTGAANCGGSNAKFTFAKFDGSDWQNLTQAGSSAASFDDAAGATLAENAAGHYTYRSATSVAATKDGATVHRVGMRLCFTDPATGATVKVNPYLDFTVGANGTGNPVKDGQNRLTARRVADKASCNECHQTLAARHDDGLVDPNMCVTCHNKGSVHFATGNSLDFKLMIHKFHMGKQLKKDYRLSTFVARLSSGGVVAGVDYPQEQRNCVKCHDGSASAANRTPDGENWKTRPGKNACWACHDDYKDTTSAWYAKHQGATLAGVDRDNPDIASDSACQTCHGDTAPKINTAAVHAVPEWVNGANYQYNIHAVTWNADRTVSVEFSVINPVNGSAYDIKGASFANLTLLFGWGDGDYSNAGAVDASGALIPGGQPVAINVASKAVAVAGTNNRYRVTSTVVPASASGTSVVALQGGILLTGVNGVPYTVPVKDAVSYFAIGGSGSAIPRRTVVSADKCNTCHGRNINMNNHVPSHAANSNDPAVCVICHNGNSVLNGTTVAGGAVTALPESAHFKRMIHMKHKAQGANYPVMPSTLRTAPSALGSYTGYTGVRNCDACHVNGSYMVDMGTMGSSTKLDVALAANSANATITDTDPSNNPVISPKAAACSSCHDDDTAKNHMINVGGAAFGTKTQGDIAGGTAVYEACYGCHASGGVAPVDTKHGLK